MQTFEDFAESIGRKAWNDLFSIIIGKSKAKTFPLEKKIMQPIQIKHILEAMEEHRTVDEYISYLQKMAGIKTKFDYILNCWNEYPEIKERRMLEEVLAVSGHAASLKKSEESTEAKSTAEGDIKNEVEK